MEYIAITFRLSGIPTLSQELLPHFLEPLGFEGFNNKDDELIAYIPADAYHRESLIQLLRIKQIHEDCFSENNLPDKNWNEEWERNFEPVVIDEKCLIRAPFHEPDNRYPYEIVIEPKMSFGTGHHATTALMLSEMLTLDFRDKSVLDAGCGTGILAIMAEKLGAGRIAAFDIDEWCHRSAMENASINHCNRMKVFLGSTESVKGSSFDIILANINLNILLSELPHYFRLLQSGGLLIMSGILESDSALLKTASESRGLVFGHSKILNNWALTRFKKI